MEEFICPKCGQEKPKEEFERSIPGILHTTYTHCRECRKRYIEKKFTKKNEEDKTLARQPSGPETTDDLK